MDAFICVEERIWWIIALLEGEYVAIIITMLVMGILLGLLSWEPGLLSRYSL